MAKRCDTLHCNAKGYTFIWQVQVDGHYGWTVLCERHGSKGGYFTRDGATRGLVPMVKSRRWKHP